MTARSRLVGRKTQLGASRWAALARNQRARLAHAGEDILTPAEQRVAGLVGEGLTNAEMRDGGPGPDGLGELTAVRFPLPAAG